MTTMQWPIKFYGDDLIDQAEAALILGIKPAMVRKYMKGHHGKPPLPYVRFTRKPHFSRYQIALWLETVQGNPDPMMVDVRRATRNSNTP